MLNVTTEAQQHPLLVIFYNLFILITINFMVEVIKQISTGKPLRARNKKQIDLIVDCILFAVPYVVRLLHQKAKKQLCL